MKAKLFLLAGAVSALALAATSCQSSSKDVLYEGVDLEPSGNPIFTSSIPFSFVAGRAVPFRLNEVELLDSPFLANKKRNADFLLTLSPDRLMARMYEYCGETPKAPVYGGWESSDLSGHTLGHYLTALSLEYASTGDARFKERVDYIIGEMARCQKLYGDSGYIGCMSRNARRALEVLKDGDVETINHTWAPWYTQHKIAEGLYDAWKVAGNEQAKDVLVNFARWVDGLTKGLDEKKCQRMLDMEFGGLGEVFWKLYAETKDETHKALAQRFRHHWLVDDLAAGKDNLAGKHANTQVPKVVAEAVNYEVTGDEFARKVSKNFFDIVTKNHTYCTGGNSDREQFYRPSDADKHLSPASVECCNVYNMIRLAEHLQMQEPTNTIYGDYRERALLNQILPSQDPERSMFTYFVSLRPGQFRVYSSPDQSFWCCFGTGIENHTKYNNAIYFHDDDNLYVTLFIPSKLKWADRGLELTMNTQYPKNGDVVLTFDKAPEKKLALNVRCPGWTDGPVTFTLNGQQIATGKPGENAVLNADWKTGDKLAIHIPMKLRTEHLHGGHTELNAFFYGPTLLAGDLGEVENYKKRIYLRNQLDLQNAACKPVPILLGGSIGEITAAAKAVAGSDRAFNLTATDGSNVLIRPFNQMPYQHYNVYWKNMDEAQWAAEKAKIAAEEARQRERAARTVDEMNFGEQQPETDHALKAENTHSGRFNQRGYRGAHQGGWIEFRMKVSPDKKNLLACTYWGGDNGTETAILADGQQIAVQRLSAAHPNQFFEVEYEIPESITKGKDHIVIRHQPAGNRGGIGSVYHAAILTAPVEVKTTGNPLFKDVWTADPAALVVGDTLYLYAGHDDAHGREMFTIKAWRCYSTKDLVNWKSYGDVLTSTDFPYGQKNTCWAAQVVKKGDTYYWYVTIRNDKYGGQSINVATSDNPVGPWKTYEKPVVTDNLTRGFMGWNDIDPTCLIDDDGTAWLCWGNGNCYLAKLKDNMLELDGEIIDLKMQSYEEGPWLYKRNGLYYCIYASRTYGDEANHKNPQGNEVIAYATAEKITGPWTYRGQVTGSARNSFTIHPAVVDFKGRTFLFYHNAALSINGEGGALGRRAVCVDEMFFNEDGTIKPVRQTNEGIQEPVK